MQMVMRSAMANTAAAVASLADMVVTGTFAAVADEEGYRHHSILSDVLEAYTSQHISALPPRGSGQRLALL